MQGWSACGLVPLNQIGSLTLYMVEGILIYFPINFSAVFLSLIKVKTFLKSLKYTVDLIGISTL